MRLPLSAYVLSLFLFKPIFALPQEQSGAQEAVSIQTASPKAPSTAEDDGGPKYTRFNGIEVPPMKELNGDFDKDVKEGYWFIKYHSPYCHHCHQIAPTWQTLYEFYYTSNPISQSQSQLNSFHPYYDFHFASIDCVAYGSTCEAHGVNSYPTFRLYKNGVFEKKFAGTRDLQGLSHFVEEVLESIKPGSRPKEGVKLPKVGASGVDVNAKPDQPVAKDKDAAAGAAAGQSHNEKAAQAVAKPSADAATTTTTGKVTQPTTEIAKVDRPPKKASIPNLLGNSLSLSAESFQKLVTTTQDAWFVKFYAPWCHHCQAMAANWAQLGREMKGKLNIGEVNCDAETRLCKDVRIKGFPTILFFKGGERVEYDGLRGLGDLIDFSKKALDVADDVKDVDAAAFKKMEETEEVIFLYFFDHATTSEDFTAIDRVRLSLIGHGKLVKTDDPILADRFKISTWPRLVVSRDGRPSYYNALAPRDMRDYRKILGWMKSVWLPIVPELTASNSRGIMDGKYVVLGVLSRNRPDEFMAAKREIKNAALEWMDKETHAFQLERQELRDAKQLRIEEAEDRGDQRALNAAKGIRINMEELKRKEVGFAWIDGVFWERWLRTTYGVDVKDGERVIINDEENRRYWDTTVSGNYIMPSRTSILETLPKVVSSPPKLKPKSTTSSIGLLLFEIRKAFHNHPYFGFAGVLAALVTLSIWGRGRIRRGRGVAGGLMNGSSGHGGVGFFKLDGKEGGLSGSAGSHGGGNQNGKVD
ncbi:MAG: hypothetical protein M1816_001486 [Peltula sp. TS41687]|nr:MAG: hypothetical protein M1816_001486 [Peltula sp. TS41687]